MAKGFKHGSGGLPLNFRVAGGTSRPTNPRENTIWINTDQKITGWVFSATQPTEPTDGMVWLTTGISSSAEFNVLKKNGIQVYPVSVKQYISGAWVEVTAKSYQNGKWVDWVTYLYNKGDECTGVTGGWKYLSDGALKATFDTEQITVTNDGFQNQNLVLYTNQKIDVTRHSWLVVEFADVQFPTGWSGQGIDVGLANTNTTTNRTNMDVAKVFTGTTGNFDVKVPLDGIEGEYFPAIGFSVTIGNIKKVYLTNGVA